MKYFGFRKNGRLLHTISIKIKFIAGYRFRSQGIDKLGQSSVIETRKFLLLSELTAC
jgi:hypothetical protein